MSGFDVRLRKRLGALDLDVAFEGDGIVALHGPSGAGKTSVLNMVAGLLAPDAGRVAVGGDTLFDSDAGVDRRPEDRRAGYVFQDGRLFPHLTVRANLLYGRRADRPALVTLDAALDLLGIKALLDRWPRHLSGGETQRVAIGRAPLASPRFLLLDEPLAHVDRPRRADILALVERLRDTLGLPILYVTHDTAEIERLGATRVDL